MSRNIMLVPIGTGVGLTSVSLGMVRALERRGVKVQFFKLFLSFVQMILALSVQPLF